MFPFYLLATTGYLVDTSGYLVVNSGYLITTTGYLWLLVVTSRYFWFLILVTTFQIATTTLKVLKNSYSLENYNKSINKI